MNLELISHLHQWYKSPECSTIPQRGWELHSKYRIPRYGGWGESCLQSAFNHSWSYHCQCDSVVYAGVCVWVNAGGHWSHVLMKNINASAILLHSIKGPTCITYTCCYMYMYHVYTGNPQDAYSCILLGYWALYHVTFSNNKLTLLVHVIYI